MRMYPVVPEVQTLSEMLRSPVVPAVPTASAPIISIRTPNDVGELGQFWPFIRGGLAKIKKRQGHRSTWHPEHIRAAIEAGRAELWMGIVSGEPVGFMVVQPTVDPFLCIPTSLFVWFAYSDPKAPKAIVDQFDQHLCDTARTRGFAYVECLTARPGLGRRMKRNGWQTIMEVIRKDLWED